MWKGTNTSFQAKYRSSVVLNTRASHGHSHTMKQYKQVCICIPLLYVHIYIAFQKNR